MKLVQTPQRCNARQQCMQSVLGIALVFKQLAAATDGSCKLVCEQVLLFSKTNHLAAQQLAAAIVNIAYAMRMLQQHGAQGQQGLQTSRSCLPLHISRKSCT
jgi:hypothetical protein